MLGLSISGIVRTIAFQSYSLLVACILRNQRPAQLIFLFIFNFLIKQIHLNPLYFNITQILYYNQLFLKLFARDILFVFFLCPILKNFYYFFADINQLLLYKYIISKMRQGPNSGQYQKFQIKQPPNFANFYRKLEEQKNKKKYQDAPTIRSKNSEENSIGLQRYQRKNQPVLQKTHSMTLRSSNPLKKSTENMPTQHPMYKTNTTNTFYQDRQQAKALNFFQTIQPLIRSILLILLAIWGVLYFVQPYQGFCPHNAQCGVYIHCINGYVLDRDECIISKESKNNAYYICTAAIQNLKEKYGTKQCEQPQKYNYKPSTTFGSIIQEYENYYQINQATRTEIYQWLSNPDHKKLYKYSFDGNILSPDEKKYTIFCRFQKMVRQPWYYPIYVLVLVGIFVILVYVRMYKQKRRIYKIYEYLKAKVQQKNDIIIDIEQIQRRFGKIYRALWDNIQQLRRQDKKICYYEDEYLHWKLI